MNNAFINNDNAGTVMAWCSVFTLTMGVCMTIYQFYQHQKHQEALDKAQEAMKSLPLTNAESAHA